MTRSLTASFVVGIIAFAGAALYAGPARAQASRPASPQASAASVGPEAVRAQATLVFEIDETHLKVQEMWELRNMGAGPVPASALVFPLGDGVSKLNLDEASQKSFVADEAGRVVRARSDLAPGAAITLSGAYWLDLDGRDSARVSRPFPVPVAAGRVILEEVEGVELTGSTSFSSRLRDLSGRTFRIFDFGGLPAGHAFFLEISGLPTRNTIPRDIAVVLSLAAFAWMIVQVARRRPEPASDLVLGALSPEARQEQLLRALQLLEEDRLAGRIEGKRHDRRRKALMTELAEVLREVELARSTRSRGV